MTAYHQQTTLPTYRYIPMIVAWICHYVTEHETHCDDFVQPFTYKYSYQFPWTTGVAPFSLLWIRHWLACLRCYTQRGFCAQHVPITSNEGQGTAHVNTSVCEGRSEWKNCHVMLEAIFWSPRKLSWIVAKRDMTWDSLAMDKRELSDFSRTPFSSIYLKRLETGQESLKDKRNHTKTSPMSLNYEYQIFQTAMTVNYKDSDGWQGCVIKSSNQATIKVKRDVSGS